VVAHSPIETVEASPLLAKNREKKLKIENFGRVDGDEISPKE